MECLYTGMCVLLTKALFSDAGSRHDRSVQLSGGRCYGISLATYLSAAAFCLLSDAVVYPRGIDVSACLLRVKQLLKRCCNNCVRCVNTNHALIKGPYLPPCLQRAQNKNKTSNRTAPPKHYKWLLETRPLTTVREQIKALFPPSLFWPADPNLTLSFYFRLRR